MATKLSTLLTTVLPMWGAEEVMAKKNNVAELNSTNDQAFVFNVIADGTDSSNWPNRIEFTFKPVGEPAKMTTWLNEYGEFRCIPAKKNTVGWRMFLKEFVSDEDRTSVAWQICDDRTNRNVIAEADGDGLRALNINKRVDTVPAGTAVPVGTPDGTLFVEYTP